MALDHLKAKELGRHVSKIESIRRRAQRWRLTDCTEEMLVDMRHALIEEMERVGEQLEKLDREFTIYLQRGAPLETEGARREIDRLALIWEQHNNHLQEIDEAILERHLRTRLVATFGSEHRLDLWEASIFILIVVAVTITVIEIFVPLAAATQQTFVIVDTVICVFLLGDFFLRWRLAEDNGWYLRRYWIDLVASIPFYEFLRFGRLVRVVRFARLFRLLRAVRAARVLLIRYRNLDTLLQTLEMNLLKRSVLIAAALLFIGALSIRVVEPLSVEAPQDLPESLWWSFVTVVTGGFADLYNPTTFSGQLLTAGLVLLGLTVTGIFTASLTSVLVESESSRLEQAQQMTDRRLMVLDQKMDLLSGETNAGLIAMEVAAQRLSNAATEEAVAQVLIEAMRRDFDCLQASVHLVELDGGFVARGLVRVASSGDERATPPERMPAEGGLLGRLTADFLTLADPAAVDIEPITEPAPTVSGTIMICPLVAGHRLLGMLHAVLPDHLSRYYLYNRAPMTLAHHAAIAFLALQQKREDSSP